MIIFDPGRLRRINFPARRNIDIVSAQPSALSRKPKYKLSALNPSEITDRLVSAWVDLESRAIEANAYLSPYFVLPAIKYLETKGVRHLKESRSIADDWVKPHGQSTLAKSPS